MFFFYQHHSYIQKHLTPSSSICIFPGFFTTYQTSKKNLNTSSLNLILLYSCTFPLKNLSDQIMYRLISSCILLEWKNDNIKKQVVKRGDYPVNKINKYLKLSFREIKVNNIKNRTHQESKLSKVEISRCIKMDKYISKIYFHENKTKINGKTKYRTRYLIIGRQEL